MVFDKYRVFLRPHGRIQRSAWSQLHNYRKPDWRQRHFKPWLVFFIYMHHHTTTLLGRKSFQIMQWNTSRQQKINIDIEICYVTWKFTETSFWSTLWEEGNIEWMFICPRPQSNLSLFQFLQRTLLDHQSPAKSSGWHPQDLWPQLWTLLPETLAPFSMPPRLDRSV